MCSKITYRDILNLAQIAEKLQCAKFRDSWTERMGYKSPAFTNESLNAISNYAGMILDAAQYFMVLKYGEKQ